MAKCNKAIAKGLKIDDHSKFMFMPAERVKCAAPKRRRNRCRKALVQLLARAAPLRAGVEIDRVGSYAA